MSIVMLGDSESISIEQETPWPYIVTLRVGGERALMFYADRVRGLISELQAAERRLTKAGVLGERKPEEPERKATAERGEEWWAR